MWRPVLKHAVRNRINASHTDLRKFVNRTAQAILRVFRNIHNGLRLISKSVRGSWANGIRPFNELVRIIKCAQEERVRNIEREEATSEEPPFHLELLAPVAITGVVYTLVFVPWSILYAVDHGNDPLSALFFLAEPKNLADGFWTDFIPDFREPGSAQIALSLGAMYGVAGLMTFFIFAAGGITKLVISANSIFFGYLATATLFGIGVSQEDIFGRETILKISYLMFAYYLATSLPNLLSSNELRREKFVFLTAGAQGLFAGWILTEGYGTSAAVFTGFVYLGCTFAMFMIFERLFVPIFEISNVLASQHGIDLPNLDQVHSARSVIAVVRHQIRNRDELFWISFPIHFLFPILVAAIVFAWLFTADKM